MSLWLAENTARSSSRKLMRTPFGNRSHGGTSSVFVLAAMKLDEQRNRSKLMKKTGLILLGMVSTVKKNSDLGVEHLPAILDLAFELEQQGSTSSAVNWRVFLR